MTIGRNIEMRSVSKQEFDAFLASTTTRSEPEAERDGEYAYETWLDLKGNAVASVAYRAGEAVSWMIAGSTLYPHQQDSMEHIAKADKSSILRFNEGLGKLNKPKDDE
jgi:hypothetical protein